MIKGAMMRDELFGGDRAAMFDMGQIRRLSLFLFFRTLIRTKLATAPRVLWVMPLHHLLITNHVKAAQERARIRRERAEAKRSADKTVAESFALLSDAGALLERDSELFQ
jgi:hypothetical protein